MKSITKLEVAVSSGKSIERRLILLSYLQYHYDNPCLHPDDVYIAGSGYHGIGPVIVYLANQQTLPTYVEYPTEFLKVKFALEKLNNCTDIEYQHIDVVDDFLDTFDETLLEDVIYSLNELANIDETNILIAVRDILEYVITQ